MDFTDQKPEKKQRLGCPTPDLNPKEFTNLKLLELNVKYEIVIRIYIYTNVFIFLMPLLRKLIGYKCCFCVSLNTGCIIISFYTLFFGFINAVTIVDEALYRQTNKTDIWTKWFNVFHIALMIGAAVILLVAVLSKCMEFALVWLAMFIIHIISYYIVFNGTLITRNPFVHGALALSIYVLLNFISLIIDIYCVIIVCFQYYVRKHPEEFRAPCVDK